MADSHDEDSRPNPDEKLVRVFDSEQESEALIVRGLLESAGIDSDLTSLDAYSLDEKEAEGLSSFRIEGAW